jgi:hypothetical protein
MIDEMNGYDVLVAYSKTKKGKVPPLFSRGGGFRLPDSYRDGRKTEGFFRETPKHEGLKKFKGSQIKSEVGLNI